MRWFFNILVLLLLLVSGVNTSVFAAPTDQQAFRDTRKTDALHNVCRIGDLPQVTPSYVQPYVAGGNEDSYDDNPTEEEDEDHEDSKDGKKSISNSGYFASLLDVNNKLASVTTVAELPHSCGSFHIGSSPRYILYCVYRI